MRRSALPVSVGAQVSLVALGFLAIVLALLPQQSSLSDLTQALGRDKSDSYAKLPLSFIPNRGQTDENVRYYAQGKGFGFYFTDDKAVLSFQEEQRGQALQLRFVGASADATLSPDRQGPGKVNYLRGEDPRKWQTGLPTYEQVGYQGLWPGVDMTFRGAAGKLKYEFRLKPGASAKRIRLAYAGARGLSLSGNGSLLIRTPSGTLRDSAPRAWQEIGGRKVAVQSRYVVGKSGGAAQAYGFELGAYDPSQPLVIDPGLVYSTYLGGSSTDTGEAIAVDGAGSAYVTGRADSASFPTTPGAFDVNRNGSSDAFVTKLSPDGSALAYSTFLGGTSIDQGNGIAVDGAGIAYVTGETSSSNFPTTPGALDSALNGNDDAFVTKLSADGSALSYSTYLGGTGNIDSGNDITVDGAGSAYVTGETISTDFPTTPGAFDTTPGSIYEAFVTKLDAAGASLVYSTYLGGSGSFDHGRGIAVDSAGSAYVSGSTSSANFPTTVGAYDTTHNGDDDAFVTKLDPTGSSLAYSTFLGGNTFDGSSGIALGAGGNVYITGSTSSSDFPATAGAFDTTYNSDGDAFVTKLNAAGSALAYSTFLGGTGAGGTGYDAGSGIAVDGTGRAWVTGRTDSVVFPTTTGAFDTLYGPVGDAFVTQLNAVGSALSYSTFLGGSTGGSTGGTDQGSDVALDWTGDVYVAGYTTSSDFPTTAGAFDPSSNGGFDAFVTKFFGPGPYARPGSATPLRASLVPEYRQCTAPNSMHVAPLAHPSCSPPAQSSPLLTTSTIGRGWGSATLKVRNGDPSTPADEADVAIDAALSDVQSTAGGGDYTGKVILKSRVRMTDTRNGTSGRESATVSDFELSVPIDCVATAAPERGSHCDLTTTLDTLVPGFVMEGARAVVSTFSVNVEDAGADGEVDPGPGPGGLGCPPACGTGDESVYLRQGIFTP
jgi:hypothetical protein